MKSIRVRLCAITLLVSLTTGCNQGEALTGRGGGISADDKAPGVRTAETIAATTPVSLEFFGTIAHLLGPNNKRAVFMRSQHLATMTVRKGITEAHLKKAWAANEVVCRHGQGCTVPLTDISIQFASQGTVFGQPSMVTTGSSFDDTVPHLAGITGNSGHGKFNAVKQEVHTPDPPATGNRISSWVELPAGEFSATINKWTGRFDPDHENKRERTFGEDITLTAAIDTPTLVVRKGGNKWELPVDVGGLVLRFVNAPVDNPPRPHFHLFYDLSSGPLTDAEERPRIRPIRYQNAPALSTSLSKLIFEVLDQNMEHGMSMTDSEKKRISATPRELELINMLVVEVPGCSNSQWP
jgi:hypothetical protein